jgi:DNA-binding MarR family transcriptional regulator
MTKWACMLTGNEMIVLVELYNNPQTPMELSTKLKMSYAKIRTIINSLREHGLIGYNLE